MTRDGKERITVRTLLDDEHYEKLEAELEKIKEMDLPFASVIIDNICAEYTRVKASRASHGRIMGVWDEIEMIKGRSIGLDKPMD